MIKAVVIDDEINSRELLEEMLANYINDVELVGMGNDVSSGVEIIKSTKPNIVLLDIEMPGGDGFKILDSFEEIWFSVIFITGFQDYALRAIKYSALDYILKPINLEELQIAVDKVKLQDRNLKKNYELLKSFRDRNEEASANIAINGVTKQHFIKVEEILAVIIQNSSTMVILKSGMDILCMSPLLHFDTTLSSEIFMRIHKSALVNLKAIAHIDNGRTGFVHLNNGLSLPFSSRKKAELLKRMKDIV